MTACPKSHVMDDRLMVCTLREGHQGSCEMWAANTRSIRGSCPTTAVGTMGPENEAVRACVNTPDPASPVEED